MQLLLVILALFVASVAGAQPAPLKVAFPPGVTVPLFVFPAGAVSGGGTVNSTLCFDAANPDVGLARSSANNLGITNCSSTTYAILGSSGLTLDVAGVRQSAADGVLTLLGLGNGNDENLTIDFDNATANTVAIASGTGVTTVKFGMPISVFAGDGLTGVSLDKDAAVTFSSTADPVGSADTGFKRGGASVAKITNGGAGYGTIDSLAVRLSGKTTFSGTAPTIASGFNTTPTIAASNGTAALAVSPGGTGATNTGVLTMPAATTGWACSANDLTDSGYINQVATTTTSASFKIYSRTTGLAINWPTTAASISIQCAGY